MSQQTEARNSNNVLDRTKCDFVNSWNK